MSYLQALLGLDRQGAWQLIEQAIEGGVGVPDLYLQVFQPAQHEIGRLWETNRVSVAQEHFCTAVTQSIMARLHRQIFSTPRLGRTAIVAGVGGELHELGPRMVADFLEMAGWDSLFLGANTPARDMAGLMLARRADVVCLSCTMTSHIASLIETVDVLRTVGGNDRFKILVGGDPFNRDPELWKKTGADGYAPDAAFAADLAARLFLRTS